MIQKIKNIFDGFSCKKKSFFVFLSIIACLVFGIAIFGKPVFASTADLVSQIFVFAGGFLMNLLSTLLLGMTDILVGVISYNSFLDATVVVKGWILVRDICNMFFIFILIYNAFLMVLGIESQGDPKRNILKVLLAAILINFSRLICGIIIDFSQVIMLSFVNAFKDAIANNLLSALAVQDLLHINRERMLIESGWGELAGAMVLALIMVTISTLIVLALLLTLIVRVVVLWLSIILSPLAFVVGLVPFGKSFANEWWQNFTKNVISGPVLAFFLWLVFSLTNSQPNLGQEIVENETASTTVSEAVGSTVSIAITEAGSSENLSSFLVAVILLVMSIGMAKKFGAVGAGTFFGMADKAINWGKNTAINFGKRKAKQGVEATGRLAMKGLKTTDLALGRSFGMEGGLIGTGARKATGFIDSVRTQKWVTDNLDYNAKISRAMAEAEKKKTRIGKEYDEKIKNETDSKKRKALQDKKKEAFEKVHVKIGDKKYKEENGRYYRVNKDGELVNSKGETKDANGNLINFDTAEKLKKNRYLFKGKVSEFATSKINDKLNYGLKKISGGRIDVNIKDMLTKDAKKMNKIMSSWTEASVEVGSTAKAANLKAELEKISEEAKKVNEMDLKSEEKLSLLKRGDVSKKRKQAVALSMAENGDFKDMSRVEVDIAKDVLSDNSKLKKEFEKLLNKKFAHLNFDLNTQEGKDGFKKALEAGKMDDIMDATAYKNADVMKIIKESKSSDEYQSYMKKVLANSGIRKAAIEGLQNTFEKDEKTGEEKVVDTYGSIESERLLLAKFTGDLGLAFKNLNLLNSKNVDKLDKALLSLFVKMQAKDKAKISVDNFNPDKVASYFNNDDQQAKIFVDSLKSVVATLDPKKEVESIRKAGAPEELMKILDSLAKGMKPSSRRPVSPSGGGRPTGPAGPGGGGGYTV